MCPNHSPGYYMYTETSSGRRPGDTADLMSPPLSGDNEGLCLQFYYYMYGRDIGNLVVYILPELSDYQSLVEISRDQGQKWFHKNVDIEAIPFEDISGNFTINNRDLFLICILGSLSLSLALSFRNPLCSKHIHTFTTTPTPGTSFLLSCPHYSVFLSPCYIPYSLQETYFERFVMIKIKRSV